MTHAEVLIQSLPYIRQFYGKTVVVKYGGAAMLDESLKAAVMQDVTLMHYIGVRPILVHGGGPEISDAMAKMGKVPQFVGGLRVTDAETMEIVEMVLTGKTNKSIVTHLNRAGAKSVGISGKDADLLIAERETAQGDIGFVGRIKKVQPEILGILSNAGYIPVISSVAVGENGESYNVNADTAAGEIAAAVGASKLILMTDVEGIFRDFSDKDSLIKEMNTREAQALIASGAAQRGMIPKLSACISAIAGGVERAHIIDGRNPHSLLVEIFTDEGIGTMVTA